MIENSEITHLIEIGGEPPMAKFLFKSGVILGFDVSMDEIAILKNGLYQKFKITHRIEPEGP